MKKTIAICVILCLFLTGCYPFKMVRTDMGRYTTDCTKVCNAGAFMPKVSDLGTYESVQYTYQKTLYSQYPEYFSEGMALFVQYIPVAYEVKKTEALQPYSPLEKPVLDREDNYCLPLPSFTYRGYQISVIPDPEYVEVCACRSFAMVGTNDADCTVVYLYFSDPEIDYLAMKGDNLQEAMVKLMDTSFSWVTFQEPETT